MRGAQARNPPPIPAQPSKGDVKMSKMRAKQNKTRRTRRNTTLAGAALRFGPRPLLHGEDPDAFDNLYAQVSAAVGPSDMLEAIWVHDIVELEWQLVRLRQLRIDLLNLHVRDYLKHELVRLSALKTAADPEQDDGTCWDVETLIAEWIRRKPRALKVVVSLLALENRSMDDVYAVIFARDIEKYERLDYLIAGLEGRRNTIVREIDRHRLVLGSAVRQALALIEGRAKSIATAESTGPKRAP
jgi:hypothetical protein